MLSKIIKVFCFSILISSLMFASYIYGFNNGLSQGQENQIFMEIPKSTSSPTPKETSTAKPIGTKSPTTKAIKWGGPELWQEVNKRRIENGVNALSQKDELCTIASIRLNELRELGKLDAHQGFSKMPETRSDLKWIFEKYNLAEYLIVGYDTPQETVQAWEHTLGHKSLVTGGEWVWGCIYSQDTFGVAITAY